MERTRAHFHVSCLAALAAAALSSGCAGTVNAGAPAAGAAARAASGVLAPAGTNPFAGQYAGTARFGALHNGAASASLVQSQTAVGGMLTATFAKTTYVYSLAAGATGGSFGGVTVATIGSVACSFTLTGTYDPTTHKLAISYAPARGCVGKSGTFAMTKQCYYQEGGPLQDGALEDRATAAQPDNGLHQC